MFIGVLSDPLTLELHFENRVSLCSPGCPGTHFVDQAVLTHRDPLNSASWVLGLKASTTTVWLFVFFFKEEK